jgi:hypothetical protein
MGIDAKIVGTHGRSPTITEYGQLVVGPIAYSKSSVVVINATSTGFMAIPPISGHKIVLTSAFVRADKNVSATVESDIEVYESETSTGTVSTSDILNIGLTKQQFVNIPMNYISSEGTWIMCSASDATVNISIFYYYVPNDL